MTITDNTTPTRSKHGDRHAASIYQLLELRLQYLTAAIGELIENHGEQPDRRRDYAVLTARYEKIASEWLAEPITFQQEEALPAVLALAKFTAFVNVDRGLLDLITDNATIVGEEVDRHHVGLALASVIKWIVEQEETQQRKRKEMQRAGGAA